MNILHAIVVITSYDAQKQAKDPRPYTTVKAQICLHIQLGTGAFTNRTGLESFQWNGPNNWSRPGKTRMDLYFTYFSSISFIYTV